MVRLDGRIDAVVGGRTSKALAKAFGIRTAQDLLQHLPRRYVQRNELSSIADLQAGDHVTVMAEVVAVRGRPMRRRRGHITEVIVGDGTDRLALTFFNQRWREQQLKAGQRGLFSGQVQLFNRDRQLTHPDYEIVPDSLSTDEPSGRAKDLTLPVLPIYPASGALASWKIMDAIRLVLEEVQLDETDDAIPAQVRAEHGLVGLSEALWQVHRPDSLQAAHEARTRLRFQEAWIVQVLLAQRRNQAAAAATTAWTRSRGDLVDRLHERLPFDFTQGQRAVWEEISEELAQQLPMSRLLQGEVGSGKTVVALSAMLQVVSNGGQAVLLAPTEVLAAQHYTSISRMLGPLGRAGQLDGDPQGTRVTLLTGSQPVAARRQALLDIATGSAGIVVGTHALLSDPVDFFGLGLAVIDEQHRFGVEQRAALVDKAGADRRAHVLVMTATPIPRTVAMTVFGDLEVSTIRELPPGRAPITTHLVPQADRPHYLERAWQRIAEEVAAGRQAFIVCPRIGEPPTQAFGEPPPSLANLPAGGQPSQANEGEQSTATTVGVLELAEYLRTGPLQGLAVGVLHGRLTAEEKDEAMAAFTAEGSDRLDVLVATTVIEVGVDVPNATVMLVTDADRFGVSQLHQLRGRVGRGKHGGLCLLHTRLPPGAPGRDRLTAVASTSDGFTLAEIDLAARREGDVLGAAQSGARSSLQLLSVFADEDVITAARRSADAVVADSPDLSSWPGLQRRLAEEIERSQAEYAEKS